MPRSLLDLNSPPVAVMPLVRRFLAKSNGMAKDIALQRAETASTERNSEISPLLARAIELERRKQAKEASCLGDPDATIVIDFTLDSPAKFSTRVRSQPLATASAGNIRLFPAPV